MMELSKIINLDPNEKPLDNLVTDGGFCRIFRTIACVGDSMSSGEHVSTNEKGEKVYNDYFEYSWGQYMARMCGNTVYNFSRGGMTAKEYTESFAQNNGYWEPCKAAQAYIIAMGCNDLSTWEPNIIPGDVSDIDLNDWRNNKDTFVGCYGKIIQRYKEISPNAKFFLVTRPQTGTTEDSYSKFAVLLRDLIYKIADVFDNTYIIDLWQYGPVHDKEFCKLFYMAGHMGAAGYLVSAQITASYIDYIIRHNMDDFRQIGFVTRGIHNENYKW